MTESESSRLIAETLRLDGEATPGPWFSAFNHWGKCDIGRVVDPAPPIDVEYKPGQYGCSGLGLCERITKEDVEPHNADLIASYRTAAPRLARMVQELIDFIKTNEDKYATDCLDRVARIAKGEQP